MSADILDQDIQLLESVVMDDVPDGGRGPTGKEIKYGKENSIFGDVTEVNRAGGSVSIRQIFMGVRTANTAKLMDPSIILAQPSNDPNVSITLARCGLFAKRSEIANAIANYLIPGVQLTAILMQDHVSGMSSIKLIHRPGTQAPNINSTLVLSYQAGTSQERIQYVRVIGTSTEQKTHTYQMNGTYVDYPALETKVDISGTLKFDFPGSPPARDFVTAANKTIVRDTTVADAAEYYGASPLTTAASIGDTELRVASVYSQIVPNSRTETTALDQRPAAAQVITLATAPRQVDVDVAAHTQMIRVNQSNRSKSWVALLKPLPEPRSVRISYRALGVWYSLTDDGAGVLTGDGSGRVIYTTGSADMSFPALPDIDSAIIIQWAERVSYTNRSAQGAQVRMPEYVFSLEEDGYERGSLVVKWPSNNVLRTATVNAAGKFSGDADGEVDAPSGTVFLRPKYMIDAGGEFALEYQTSTQQMEILAAPTVDAGGFAVLNLAQQPAAGSLAISWATVQEVTVSSGGTATASALRKTSGSKQTVIQQPLLKVDSVRAGVGVSEFRASGGTGGPGRITTGYWGTSGVEYENVVVNITTSTEVSGTLTTESYQESAQKVVTMSTLTDDGVGGFINAMGSVNYSGKQASVRLVTAGRSTQSYKSDYDNASSYAYNDDASSSTDTSTNSGAKGGEYGTTTVGESLLAGSSIVARYKVGTTTPQTVTQTFTPPVITIDLCPYTQDRIVPGSVRFTWMGQVYDDFEGIIYRGRTDTSPGIASGYIDYAAGIVTMTDYVVSGSPTSFALASLWTQRAAWTTAKILFRTQAAPIKPTGIIVNTVDLAGNAISAIGDEQGFFVGANLRGRFDYEAGFGELQFGSFVLDSSLTPAEKAEWWYSVADIGAVEAGKIWRPHPVDPTTLRYNSVAYFYLPLDADVIGLDPVRLPPDGRVPIYRNGRYVVISHTDRVLSRIYTAGDTANCNRTRLSRVYLVGDDGNLVEGGYTVDLDSGIVTINNTTGWVQPVTVKHRIEQMVVLSGVEISGRLQLTSQLAHDFPVGSIVSSAIVPQSLSARVLPVFDQANWDGTTWSDAQIGAAAPGTYNQSAYPIDVTNAGALSERFALRVINSTDVEVIGEHVGGLGTFSRNADVAPINPISGVPYFRLKYQGWGSNWAVGNTLFLQTVGTYYAFAAIRAVQPGVATGHDYYFEIEPRGDLNSAPLAPII